MTVRLPRKEIARKLPPYQEMKRLYVEQGWSYADIAQKYDVQRAAVYHTMRRRALAYGDTWPLRSRISSAQKAQNSCKNHYVDPILIIGLVWEYIETQATAREVSVKQFLYPWAEEHNLSPSHLYELRRLKPRRMRKSFAKKLLEAIGEPVASHLEREAWLREKKYNGVRKNEGGSSAGATPPARDG